jgi:hypothetical protein
LFQVPTVASARILNTPRGRLLLPRLGIHRRTHQASDEHDRQPVEQDLRQHWTLKRRTPPSRLSAAKPKGALVEPGLM